MKVIRKEGIVGRSGMKEIYEWRKVMDGGI